MLAYIITNQQTPSYSTYTSHSTCTYAYCFLALFVCYCCGLLLQLPPGQKDVNKLLD